MRCRILFSEVVGVLSVGYAPHEALLVHGGASTARANRGAGALLRFFDSRFTSHFWLRDDGACGERAVFGHGVGGNVELLGHGKARARRLVRRLSLKFPISVDASRAVA
jgi:hypothetical protein